MKSYEATCNMFKQMEVAEKSTMGENLLKHQLLQMTTIPVKAVNEREEGAPCLPTPIRAVLASARQKCSPSKRSANRRKNMLVAWPGNYIEECKFLKEYFAKYTAQRPHYEKKSRSSGNKNVVRPSSLKAQQKR